MSKPIKEKTQGLLRQQAIVATREAAKDDNVSVHADALALVSQPDLMFVNAPISGIEKIDFKAMFDGHSVLDDTPVMYWQLSGDVFGHTKDSIPAGFYSVVANQKRGAVSLRDAEGKTVAQGDLSVCIQTPPTVMEKVVSGGVDSVKFGKKSVKVCGHVTVSGPGGFEVTLSGCIEVQL